MQSNNRAGLAVVAIGSGKTVNIAFDVKRLLEKSPGRVLYLCHQAETLARVRKMLEVVLGGAYSYGNFNGTEDRPSKVNVLLATAHAVANRLGAFKRGDFRYVVVGDAHNVQAETIRTIVQHFAPDLMLGFAATPGRADGFDIGELFGGRPVLDPDLHRALARRYVGGLDYRITTDSVEVSGILDAISAVGFAGGSREPGADQMTTCEVQASGYFDKNLIVNLAEYIRILGRLPRWHDMGLSTRPKGVACYPTYRDRFGWANAVRLAVACLRMQGVAIAGQERQEADYAEDWQSGSSEWITDDTSFAGDFLVWQTPVSEPTPAELLAQVLAKAKALGRLPRAGEVDADPAMTSSKEIKAALRASNWHEVVDHIKQHI